MVVRLSRKSEAIKLAEKLKKETGSSAQVATFADRVQIGVKSFQPGELDELLAQDPKTATAVIRRALRVA
jgi:sulfur relay (sulfurtransferase) complex TusBCD TusD component (DsrE family)